ncbi:hypothetical protein TEA_009521 [Camellia sinensis var. sinensis]|uniref:Aspartate/glutamate/uridylate kinase domain-containing protein n=1 Tax=Camellia sinensis var. sinensis TaxID=542762 RepID=A0A4S4EW06_CAMSN|nr:hypothetical protein TEA_009521 [Camellia sinensis var. sinensis]
MPPLLISSAGSAIIDLTTITSAPSTPRRIGSTSEGNCSSQRYDAFDIGFITTDDFTNADILEATYPAFAKRLHSDWISDPAIPIVTGYLGKGWRSCAVTTLGRGDSDLTATTIGKALGLQEIQVWKDVDGVLTCDPNIYPLAEPVSHLTFEEAAELAYFGAQVLHPQSMRPARECDIPVRVKNSYNPKAPGTLITRTRDMSKVFSIFEDLGISIDAVATSEELDHVVEELEKIAVVNISLIVHDSEAEQCVRALHSAFFGSDISEVDRECGSQNGSISILRNGCWLVS